MAASKAFTGKGAVLSIGTPGGSETFTPIAQVLSHQWTAPKVGFEEITNLASPTFGTVVQKEYLSSAVDPGTYTAQALFLPSDAGYTALQAAWLSGGALYDFKVQLPMGPSQTTAGDLFAFSGFIDEQPLPDGIDAMKPIKFKLSVKLNTLVTRTAGS